MRLIDADALKKELCKLYIHLPLRLKITPVLHLLRDAPTIDAVEVVRCKDCDFYHQYGSVGGQCTLRGDYMFTNDYCSYSVKGKENDTT